MISKQRITNYLYQHEQARERKNKNRVTANIIKQEYKLDIEIHRLERIVNHILYTDRIWRLILKENPKLRGSDYDVNGSKKILEQEAQISLGYESGGGLGSPKLPIDECNSETQALSTKQGQPL
jgi:hypothetical protein